jgi:hypothetical protein
VTLTTWNIFLVTVEMGKWHKKVLFEVSVVVISSGGNGIGIGNG